MAGMVMPAHLSPRVDARRRGRRHPAVIMGGIIGACLAGIALAWILVANGVPSLERFAFERNVAATAGAALLIIVLICRFLNSPGKLFFSGIFAWAILTATYRVLEIPYSLIANRLGAFHLFILGAVVIGSIAALVWVVQIVFDMRRHPVTSRRRRLPL